MISITLPDGSIRQYDNPVSGTEIAKSIGSGLLKSSIAMTVDGEQKDLSFIVKQDANISIITRQSDEALEIIRHDCAHILAQAVQELYPNTQITFGPSIADGFYYDFYRPDTEEKFSINDFEKIEAKMAEIIKKDEPFVRQVWKRDDAHKHFSNKGEKFKAEHILTLPDNEEISVYTQGEWLDLCRGIHSPSTGVVGNGFKLMKVAGAYWRGDAKNPQLQRIYGTAWRDKKELKTYLQRLEEAEKRDHRRLGKEMDLFHIQEEAVGNVFWHPNGWSIYRALEDYIRRQQVKYGYKEVRTPQILDRSLWEKSGHWEKFREAMFTMEDSDEKTLAIKPMNCPCHVEIFKKGQISYKNLPLRMAEFGCCHRNEPSGALHGIMRVRAFTQDDAHIFCMENQIVSETKLFCEMLKNVYKDLGFADVKVKFSDRPELRAGDDKTWDKAELALKDATEKSGLEWTLNSGEGAFYGPKLEFVLTDAIGRDWQCGTLQVDFVLPERLDASYTGEDNSSHRPVMLHRAILGSFERFIGILVENYGGKFPLWIAPVQVVVATITDSASEYANQVAKKLKAKGIRVETDIRSEKINYKVREHSLKKVPVQFILGNREAEQNTVAIRRLGTDKQEVLDLDIAISNLIDQAKAPDMG
ncbi:MAG: threonine--tRNA ligase [Alphaproteobacteria bacterium]|nr:threonine--tRNA ligase [Alphaproteobacteria bacterium]